jgi:hypothetical protein
MDKMKQSTSTQNTTNQATILWHDYETLLNLKG